MPNSPDKPNQLRFSQTAGNVPSSLIGGEIGINHPDRKLYVIDGGGTMRSVDLTADLEKIAAGTPIGNAINTAAGTATVDGIPGVTPSGKVVLTGSPSQARGALQLSSSALIDDTVRAAAGNPVGDALALKANVADLLTQYPAAVIRVVTNVNPATVYTATANAAGLKKWHTVVLNDGSLRIAKLSDDESTDLAAATFGADGRIDPGPLQQTPTGAMWTSWDTAQNSQYGLPTPAILGAKVSRLERLLIGAAANTSSDFPASSKDWYETLESQTTHPLAFRTSWSQFASISTAGGIGVLGASRTSDNNIPTAQISMGAVFAAYNDNTSAGQLATGAYVVAFRKAGAGTGVGSGTTGCEVDIANFGNSVQVTPSNIFPQTGFTYALMLNSGAAVRTTYTPQTASAALVIGNNLANYFVGIIMSQDSIAGLTFDGNGKVNGGSGSAMRLPAFSQIEWWNTNGGVPSLRIVSRQLTPNTMEIAAEDIGISIGGPAGTGRVLQMLYVGGSTGAYFQMSPAFGSKVATLTLGGQANGDLAIRSIGAGVLVWDRVANTATSASAGSASALPGTPAGYKIEKLGDNGNTIIKTPYYLA